MSSLFTRPRFEIEWRLSDDRSSDRLVVFEPTPDEVLTHATALATAYNDPLNAKLLGHTALIDEADVVAHYRALIANGGHGFLLFRNGELAGDADLRGVAGGAAEFAFMIAAVSAQGRGLGTRLAQMIHAFAFSRLPLDRIYASVIPDNAASLRVFNKLGYAVDSSPAGRAYAEEPGDVTLSIERATFVRHNPQAISEIAIATRLAA